MCRASFAQTPKSRRNSIQFTTAEFGRSFQLRRKKLVEAEIESEWQLYSTSVTTDLILIELESRIGKIRNSRKK